MKKAVAGILTAAMTMSLLAGCGSGDSNSGTKDTQAPAGTTVKAQQQAIQQAHRNPMEEVLWLKVRKIILITMKIHMRL